MTKRQRKRFIAGARCPKCKSLDTIMLYFENNIEKIKCTECDYAESQAEPKVQDVARKNENVIGVFKPD